MGRRSSFSPEARERAVRLAGESPSSHDSRWPAIKSVADKMGCAPETPRKWVRRAQVDGGKRAGVSTVERLCPRLPLPLLSKRRY